MAMASGNEQSKQLLAILVAYAVVLALLGGAGFAYWLDGRDAFPKLLGGKRTSPDKTETAQIEPIQVVQSLDQTSLVVEPGASVPEKTEPMPEQAARPSLQAETVRVELISIAQSQDPAPPVVEPEVTTPAMSEAVQEPAILPSLQAETHNGDLAVSSAMKPEPLTAELDLPPRPVEPREAAPAKTEAVQEPAALPPPIAEASNKEPVVSPVKKPEPATASCKADARPWPADRTAQVKAIQILLRDLGFYGGTTYGTMGPATRAAIGKFQLAANEVETGEATELLFEALKKKCASPAP